MQIQIDDNNNDNYHQLIEGGNTNSEMVLVKNLLSVFHVLLRHRFPSVDVCR